MQDRLKEFFKKEKIEYFAVLDYTELRQTNQRLLERHGLTPKSAIVYLIPYFVSEGENISAYATSRDYHLYISELGIRLKQELLAVFPDAKCVSFGDHSPIDERYAAALGGLGILGDNGLIINEKYGSYVFIADMLCDIDADLIGKTTLYDIKNCLHCGACKRACPTGILNGCGTDCLSAITQKKGELSEKEVSLMRERNTVWGCDECQKACPYNRNKQPTDIAFFRDKRQQLLTKTVINAMTDEEFKERAYAWRGKKTIERNLDELGY